MSQPKVEVIVIRDPDGGIDTYMYIDGQPAMITEEIHDRRRFRLAVGRLARAPRPVPRRGVTGLPRRAARRIHRSARRRLRRRA